MDYLNFFDIIVCPHCNAHFNDKKNLECPKCRSTFRFSSRGKPVLLDKESTANIESISRQERKSFDKKSLLKGLSKSSWGKKIINALRPPSFSLNTSFPEVSKAIKDNLPTENPNVLFIGGIRTSDLKYFGFPKRLVIDISETEQTDIIADAHKLPFADKSFDIVICQAVLEHVRNSGRVLEEIYRILKPEGITYVSIPFIQPYHSSPSDFRRFSLTGLELEMPVYKKIASGVASGPGSALARIIVTFFMGITDNQLLKRILFYSSGWLFFWIKYLDLILHKKKSAHIMSAGVYFVGKKTNE